MNQLKLIMKVLIEQTLASPGSANNTWGLAKLHPEPIHWANFTTAYGRHPQTSFEQKHGAFNLKNKFWANGLRLVVQLS